MEADPETEPENASRMSFLPRMPVFPVAFHRFDHETEQGEIKEEDRSQGGKGYPEWGRAEKRDQEHENEEPEKEPSGTVFPAGHGIPLNTGPVIFHGKPPCLK